MILFQFMNQLKIIDSVKQFKTTLIIPEMEKCERGTIEFDMSPQGCLTVIDQMTKLCNELMIKELMAKEQFNVKTQNIKEQFNVKTQNIKASNRVIIDDKLQILANYIEKHCEMTDITTRNCPTIRYTELLEDFNAKTGENDNLRTFSPLMKDYIEKYNPSFVRKQDSKGIKFVGLKFKNQEERSKLGDTVKKSETGNP